MNDSICGAVATTRACRPGSAGRDRPPAAKKRDIVTTTSNFDERGRRPGLVVFSEFMVSVLPAHDIALMPSPPLSIGAERRRNGRFAAVYSIEMKAAQIGEGGFLANRGVRAQDPEIGMGGGRGKLPCRVVSFLRLQWEGFDLEPCSDYA